MDLDHAPLTKAMDLGILAGHFLCRSLVTTNFVLLDLQEMFFALLLLYWLRFLERRLGTAKYFIFVMFALVLGHVMRMLLLVGELTEKVATGPHSIIFAALPLLVREIPGKPRFKVFGVPFTGRVFCFAAAAQLAAFTAASRWSALCGLVPGLVYLLVFGRKSAAPAIPKAIATAAAALLLPMIEGNGPEGSGAARRGVAGATEQRGPATQATPAAAAAAAGHGGLRQRHPTELRTPERGGTTDDTDVLLPGGPGMFGGGPYIPREEDIAQLQAVCARSRIDTIAALQRCGGNVAAAADLLLADGLR